MNGLPADDPWFARLRDAYLEPWEPGHRATFHLALRVGGLAHAIAWLNQREAPATGGIDGDPTAGSFTSSESPCLEPSSLLNGTEILTAATTTFVTTDRSAEGVALHGGSSHSQQERQIGVGLIPPPY